MLLNALPALNPSTTVSAAQLTETLLRTAIVKRVSFLTQSRIPALKIRIQHPAQIQEEILLAQPTRHSFQIPQVLKWSVKTVP